MANIPITQYIVLPMIKPSIVSTPPINNETTPLIKETITPIQIRKKLIPKLPRRRSSSSSTHVTYHTKDTNIKGNINHHGNNHHSNSIVIPIDIVHVDSLGIINERLVTAAPNMNGIVVTKIP